MTSLVWPIALVLVPFAGLAGVLAVRGVGLARRGGERIASGRDSAGIRSAASLRLVRSVLVAVALVLLALALARPVGSLVTEASVTRGADVIIAIDVSLSMLARDSAPSRIERARVVLRELVDRLQGNRIGLVAFSGSSGILLPLTLDSDAARLFADQLQVQSVDAPGTSIDRAINRSIEMFDAAGEGDRILVILSDGEDLSSDPLDVARQAAARAKDANIEIATVSLGTTEGATIPLDVLGSNAVKRGADGEPVITRARPDVLAALGEGGMSLSAVSGDEAERIASWVGSADQTVRPAGERKVRNELFQIPLIMVFALLAIDYAIGAWRGK